MLCTDFLHIAKYALLIFGTAGIVATPLVGQVDTLPLSVTNEEAYPLFRLKSAYFGRFLAEVDSLRRVRSSTTCSFPGSLIKEACTVFSDTIAEVSLPTVEYTFFHGPYHTLGRTTHPEPKAFVDTVTVDRIAIYSAWAPAGVLEGALDSIKVWEQEHQYPDTDCTHTLFCRIVILEAWSEQHASRAISTCEITGGDLSVVPRNCEPLAIWDGKEWWLRTVVGHAVYSVPPRRTSSGQRSYFSAVAPEKLVIFAEHVDRLMMISGQIQEVQFSVRGRVDLARVRSAVARALSAAPRPHLQTRVHLDALVGTASRRVSPILDPYREIVEVLVMFHSTPEGHTVSVRPYVLVNRYNDPNDQSYHPPNPADLGRYEEALRSTIRTYLSRVCNRASWNAQILNCS